MKGKRVTQIGEAERLVLNHVSTVWVTGRNLRAEGVFVESTPILRKLSNKGLLERQVEGGRAFYRVSAAGQALKDKEEQQSLYWGQWLEKSI